MNKGKRQEIIQEEIVTAIKYSDIKQTKDKHLKVSNDFYMSINKIKVQQSMKIWFKGHK